MNAIEALIHPYMERRAAVGAAVAILSDKKIDYLGGFGVTSVEENGVPVTPRTLFAYGSICKNFCAALVMRLVEAGLLDLDAPVVHYLPDLRFSRPDYGAQITLRHLLSHTSGLPMGGKYWGPRDPDSLRRFVYEQIPHYTFLSPPGAVHLYSNTVFCVAGYVAEAVTGKYYDDLAQEYLFDPLQMHRVTYDPTVAMTYSVALPHEIGADGQPHVLHRMTYNVSGNPSSFALGSVADLANLAQMYLNHGEFGGQRFVSAAAVDEMQQLYGSHHIDAAIRLHTDNYLGYGLGFQPGEYRGRRAVGHGGMNLTYNCFLKLFPDDGAGVIVLTNQCNEAVLWEMVTALYDHALALPSAEGASFEARVPGTTLPDAQQLEQYTGAYLQVESADLAAFTVVEGQLMLERQESSLSLVPVGDDQFYAQASESYRLPIAFIRNQDSEIAHVMIGGQPYHPFDLDSSAAPDLPLWQSFPGLYKDPSNSNPEEMFRVSLREGVLYVAEGAHKVPCRAFGSRAFLSELGLFEFEEAARDGVNVLVWGKAVRYYPVDEDKYRGKGIVRFLVEPPTAPLHRDE